MLAALLPFIVSLPAIAVLSVFGIIAASNDSEGWAIFWGILIGIVAYFRFDLAFSDILFGAIAYLILGLVWSFWRYKRHVDKYIEVAKERGYDMSKTIHEVAPANNIALVVSWIIIWPLSMVENLIGDILRLIRMLVTNAFKFVYEYIHQSATKGLDTSRPSKESR